jgi:hypothetical protein
MRYGEDIKLLSEEMRRVLAFFAWEVLWWREWARNVKARASSMSPELLEGLVAYAERQAALRSEMRQHFSHLWRFVPDYISEGRSEVPEEKKQVEDEDEDED